MFATHMKGSEGHVRAEDKVAAILEFLEAEHFSTRGNIAELLGIQSVARAYDCLRRMQKLELVRYRTVPVLGGTRTLWYAGESCNSGPASHLPHVLDIQLMRIRAERAGWTKWYRPTREGGANEGDAYPDAIVTDPTGALVWIEVERSIKKNYSKTIISRYKAMKSAGWQHCMFISPKPALAARVRNRIDAVADERFYIEIEGKITKARLEESKLREWFPTRSYDSAFGRPLGASLGHPSSPTASVTPSGLSSGIPSGNGNVSFEVKTPIVQ